MAAPCLCSSICSSSFYNESKHLLLFWNHHFDYCTLPTPSLLKTYELKKPWTNDRFPKFNLFRTNAPTLFQCIPLFCSMSFLSRVAFHLETSHLIWIANHLTDFYMKCSIGLKWGMPQYTGKHLNNSIHCCEMD